MPQYNLNAKVTISLYTVVEADSLEEAIEIANERNVMAIIQDNLENENKT
jgi:acyl-CoA reductase-like NAD-dependent aldehyde dehydrogenase